jgi:hypothetical protein
MIRSVSNASDHYSMDKIDTKFMLFNKHIVKDVEVV